MDYYHGMALILTITGLLAYINARYLHLPTTIGIMSGSIVISIVIFLTGYFNLSNFHLNVHDSLVNLEFHEILLEGFLSFLLFAGALNIRIKDIQEYKWEISVLAVISTSCSIFMVGYAIYYLMPLFGLEIPLIHCLIFGSLTAPTDPIAVLAIFKQTDAPKKLNIIVSGESLFNDGVAIVFFLIFFHIAYLGVEPTVVNVATMFMQQSISGMVYGMLLGWIGYTLMTPITDFKTNVLITIAIATGGYVLGEHFGFSGPLSMVMAGLIIGNIKHQSKASKESFHDLKSFWEVIDEILNAVLFMLLGLEALLITAMDIPFMMVILVIPLVLLSRIITVGIPLHFFKTMHHYPKHFIATVIWGGLRGGLAVALELSLPAGEYRNAILAITFPVVIFSVNVQGLTIKSFIRKMGKS